MEGPIYFDESFDVETFLANLPRYIALDAETTIQETRRRDLITVGLVASNGPDEPRQKVCFHVDPALPGTERASVQLQKILKATLFNPDYPGEIVFHNADFDLPLLLARYFDHANPATYRFRSLDFCRIVDTAALSRTLDNRKYTFHIDPSNRPCHGLKFLTEELYGEIYGDVVGKRNTREIPLSELVTYNIKDCDRGLDLRFDFQREALKCKVTEKTIWEYFNEVEMPFVLNVVGLNWRGVAFDHSRAKTMADLLLTAIEREENAVRDGLGRSVNLQSKHNLIAALRRNPNLVVFRNGELRPVVLPFETENGQLQVDIASFKYLRDQIVETDPASLRTRKTLNHVIRALELWQAYAQVEQLLKQAVKLSDGTYRLFPRYTIDARTGRVKCGRPNLQALSDAIFSESEIENDEHILYQVRKFGSLRSLLTVADKEKQEMISNDISGLDLGTIAALLIPFDPNTYWAQLFRQYSGHSPDTHFGLLQRTFPEEFIEAFRGYAPALGSKVKAKDLLNFWVTKEIGGKVTFVSRNNPNQVLEAESDFIPKNAQKVNKILRSGSKTSNLAISYGQGAQDYALDLTAALGRPVSTGEAKGRLQRFLNAFPELKEFKDEVMNSVYRDGYKDTPFGRRIFADVFTELNRRHVLSQKKGLPDIYQFIIFHNRSYFYVKVEGWKKADCPVVENLKLIPGRNLMAFRNVLALYELDPSIFAIKKKPDYSRRRRKSESNPIDQTKFEKTLIEITEEIDSCIAMGTAWEPKAIELRDLWDHEGLFCIPDKQVVLYRVELPTPSAHYFHKFRPFMAIARSQFAIHCQAVAAIVAKMTFNFIQGELEEKTDGANIVLFPHDQYVTEGLKCEREAITSILKRAIAAEKPGLFPPSMGYSFTGEFEGPSSNFSLS